MDSPEAASCYLRSTSTCSLHERFSGVVVDPSTRSRIRTCDPAQSRRVHAPPQGGGLAWRRRSVWTRLGWWRRRPQGYWSFRNKYRGGSFTCRGRSFTCRGGVQRRLAWLRLLRTKTTQRRPPGQTHLQRGGASGSGGRGRSKDHVPTRKQLDAQLDDYMSLSRRRLDAQLDEYMSMAGQEGWG